MRYQLRVYGVLPGRRIETVFLQTPLPDWNA
jgi:hypothetical protein